MKKKLEQTFSPKLQLHRRSSFFGYDSLESAKDKENKEWNKKFEDHMKKLENEYKEWPAQYILATQKLLDSYNKDEDFPTDKSILTKEQQEFLENAIDMKDYTKGYDKLVIKAREYALKKQWYLEKYQYYIELKEDKIKEQEDNLKMTLMSKYN